MGVKDARKTKIHPAEPVASISFQVETVTENLRRYKSSLSDQIPADLI
jgi:hypothetical protein